jgi:hypothetical protein
MVSNNVNACYKFNGAAVQKVVVFCAAVESGIMAHFKNSHLSRMK